MKRFGRLGVVAFLFLVILVIGVGAVVILKKQSTNLTTQEANQQQQQLGLPTTKVITARPENIYHEVMKSVDTKANITRVQVRGTVKQWQKNILTLVTKNQDVSVSFKDQLQFAKEPTTHDSLNTGLLTSVLKLVMI